jgi:hypothetical protein
MAFKCAILDKLISVTDKTYEANVIMTSRNYLDKINTARATVFVPCPYLHMNVSILIFQCFTHTKKRVDSKITNTNPISFTLHCIFCTVVYLTMNRLIESRRKGKTVIECEQKSVKYRLTSLCHKVTEVKRRCKRDSISN